MGKINWFSGETTREALISNALYASSGQAASRLADEWIDGWMYISQYRSPPLPHNQEAVLAQRRPDRLHHCCHRY